MSDLIERLENDLDEAQERIEELEGENKQLHADYRIQNDHIVKVNAENERLTTEIGELKAERADAIGERLIYVEETNAAIKRLTAEVRGAYNCGFNDGMMWRPEDGFSASVAEDTGWQRFTDSGNQRSDALDELAELDASLIGESNGQS